MSELDELLKAFGEAGGNRGALPDLGTAHLAASGHSILTSHTVEGLAMDARETRSGISTRFIEKGVQEIKMNVKLEKNSSATFIAHCIFPNAEKVRHIMAVAVDIGEDAEMRYGETHYHGLYGGVEVVLKLAVKVGKNGRYFNDFTLTTGRVGKLAIEYGVDAGEGSVVELTARVFGHGNDEINIVEKVILGLIKARVAVEDEATAEIRGITEGNAAGARGHVDCMEIVKDHAVAKAIPLVQVNNPLAKVTHEAAIGSVDKRQFETPMAHGLAPEEAVDVIVKGILH